MSVALQLSVADALLQYKAAVSCSKTALLIEMPFGTWTWMGPRKHTLDIRWGCTLASPGEYQWTVHVRQQCGLLSNYFAHLSLLLHTAKLHSCRLHDWSALTAAHTQCYQVLVPRLWKEFQRQQELHLTAYSSSHQWKTLWLTADDAHLNTTTSSTCSSLTRSRASQQLESRHIIPIYVTNIPYVKC